MRSRRLLAVVALMLGFTSVGTVAATADAPLAETDTVAINGVTYGPEDGLEVTTESFEVVPGGAPVGENFERGLPGGGEMSPMATWGTSYAISTETAQLYYTGKAKAGANIYDGKRIIQVCFWYSRGSSNVSSEYCSHAGTNGLSWWAGPEVTHGVWDSVDPWAPPTIFNIRTTRISPY